MGEGVSSETHEDPVHRGSESGTLDLEHVCLHSSSTPLTPDTPLVYYDPRVGDATSTGTDYWGLSETGDPVVLRRDGALRCNRRLV